MERPGGLTSEQGSSRPEIFLSPRVVDERAFGEFAEALKGLIDRAEARSSHLDTLTAESQRLTEELIGIRAAHSETLDLATRALTQVRARDDSAKQLLASATAASEAIGQFEASADAALDRKLGEIEGRLRDLHERAARRSGDLEQKLGTLLERLDARYHTLETEAATRIDSQLDAARSRIERLPDLQNAKTDALEARLESLAARAEERLATLEARTEALTGDRLEDARTKLDAVLTPATEAAAALERRLADARIALDDKLAALDHTLDERMTPGIDWLTRLCDRASEITDGGELSLRSLIAQAETVVSEAAERESTLTESRQRAEDTRTLLDTTVAQWNELIAQARRQSDEARQSVGASARAAETAREQLDAATESLRRESDGIVSAIRPRLDAMRTTLESAVERATSAGASVQQQTEGADAVRAALQRSLTALEPWRPVLLDADPSVLPPALQTLVTTVRSELASDLGSLATVMRSIADRTEGALEDRQAVIGPEADGDADDAGGDSAVC